MVEDFSPLASGADGALVTTWWSDNARSDKGNYVWRIVRAWFGRAAPSSILQLTISPNFKSACKKTEVATDVKKLLSVLRRLSVCAWAIYQCLNAYAPMAQTEYCLFLTLGKEITKKGSSSQVPKHIEYFAFFGISTCRACWGLVYPQSSN